MKPVKQPAFGIESDGQYTLLIKDWDGLAPAMAYWRCPYCGETGCTNSNKSSYWRLRDHINEEHLQEHFEYTLKAMDQWSDKKKKRFVDDNWWSFGRGVRDYTRGLAASEERYRLRREEREKERKEEQEEKGQELPDKTSLIYASYE